METYDWPGNTWCYVDGGSDCPGAVKGSLDIEERFWRACNPQLENLETMACRRCGKGSSSLPRSVSVDDCVCDDGFWRHGNSTTTTAGLLDEHYGGECLLCPKFAECKNGTPPATLPGYWRVPWREEILDLDGSDPPRLACLESTACNASDEGCAEFYEGPLCATCGHGSYRETASFRCRSCNESATMSVVFLVLVLLGTLVGIGVLTALTIVSHGEASAVDIVILRIALNSFIISAGATAFPLSWPPSLVIMFQTFAVSSGSALGDGLSADCILGESGLHPMQASGLAMAVVPPAIVLFWVAIFGLWTVASRDKTWRRLKVHLPVAIIITLLLSHPMVTKAAVRLVACRNVGGRKYLDANFHVSCESQEYKTWTFSLAVPLFLLFTLGVPLGYALAMYRHVRRDTLSTQRDVYGYLFSGFRKSGWWFELWNTIRKSLFMIASAVFAPVGVEMQTWVALVLLLFFIVVFLKTDPYGKNSCVVFVCEFVFACVFV